MKVYSECAPLSTERVCQMKGKPQDIVACLKEVLVLLESAPPKGMNRPYDPHNFNEFLSSQYGGFLNDKRGNNNNNNSNNSNNNNNNNRMNQSNSNNSGSGGGGGNFNRNNNNNNNQNNSGGNPRFFNNNNNNNNM